MKVCFMRSSLCGRTGAMEPPMWGGWPRTRSCCISYAFPFLDARVTDEGLRDHWLAGDTAHGAEQLALAVLLRDLEPREELAPLIDRMRSTIGPDATILRDALEKLAATAS